LSRAKSIIRCPLSLLTTSVRTDDERIHEFFNEALTQRTMLLFHSNG